MHWFSQGTIHCSSCDGLEVDTYLGVLVSKVVKEGGEEFIHTVNPVTVFTQNPDHGGSRERRRSLFKTHGGKEGGRGGEKGRMERGGRVEGGERGKERREENDQTWLLVHQGSPGSHRGWR